MRKFLIAIIALLLLAAPALAQDEASFTWVQSFEYDDDDFTTSNAVFDVLQFSDGSLAITDYFSLTPVDAETGDLGTRQDNLRDPFFMLQFATVAPDDTLWAVNLFEGIVQLDRDYNVLTTITSDAYDDAFIFHLAVDDNGVLYAFANEFSEQGLASRVYIFDANGEPIGSFIAGLTTDYINDTEFTGGLFIFPQDDGNLLLVDPALNYKVVNPAGEIVGDSGALGGEAEAFYFVWDVEVVDGRLYAYEQFDGLIVFDLETGELLYNADARIELIDRTAAFELGDVPAVAGIAVLEDGSVILAGHNDNYNVVTRLELPLE